MANSPFIFGANGATSLVPGGVNLPGSTSGTLQLQPAATTTSYTVTMPGSQGGASTTLSNDGSGNLSWVAGLPAVGSDGQLLKSMNSTYIQSSYYTPYVNYVGNAFAEVNTNGWATYSNTAANIPSNGTGGTATGLTFSRTTSSPLRDTGTFSLVQTNSTNVQGKGVSFSFTIDSADQARTLSIQFDYNASSTFVVSNGTTPPLNDGTTTTNAGNSDVEVFIYDVTNTVLIPVSPEVLIGNGSNNFTFKGTFQTASNSTSYRLILHCATTNANATGWTLKWSNVFVGPQYITQGPPETPWVQYTPTFVGLGTPTSVSFYSRRVGDSLEISGIFTQGTATAVANQISIGFNGSNQNVTIDSTKVTGTMMCGAATISVVNAASYNMLMTGATQYIQLSVQSASLTGTTPLVSGVGTGTVVTFFARVPISGWSSNTLMSNDANVRVVSLTAFKNAGTVTANTDISSWTTVTKDSHGTFNASTGQYTVPVAGDYFVSLHLSTNGGGGGADTSVVQIVKNGTIIIRGSQQTTSISKQVHGLIPNCVAGDIITVQNTANDPLPANNMDTYLSIFKLTGPAQIAVVDAVNARYFASSTTISGSLATVVWTTKDYDSHSEMSSGLYTIPISGKYQINTAVLVNATFTAANSNVIEIQKNSSVVTRSTVNAGGVQGSVKLLVVDQLNCIAGDVIRVQVSSAGTGPTIASSNFDNYFSIFRTGN